MRWRVFILIICLLAGIVLPGVVWGLGEGSKVVVPQIKYKGGDYNPRPHAVESLLAQIAKRTSIDVKRKVIALEPGDARLYRYPLIYMGGDQAFKPFSEKELETLRTHLTYGGFLLIDDNSPKPNSPFDQSVRRLIRRLFPHIPLERIGRDHSFSEFRVRPRTDSGPILCACSSRGYTRNIASKSAGTRAPVIYGHLA